MSTSGRKPKRLVADRRPTRKAPSKPGGAAGAKASGQTSGQSSARTGGKAKPSRRRARPPRRRGPIGWIAAAVGWVLRLIGRVVLAVVVVSALLLGASVLYVQSGLPEASALLDGRARGSVTLLDRDQTIFARRGDQFGGAVTAQSVSPHLRNAVIATEDKRFYRHFGVSPRGVAGAVRINLSEGRGPLEGHGGSTITQQTAKLLCLGSEFDPTEWKTEAEYIADCRRSSLSRKGFEAIYSMAMEAKYTKDEILSIYLNRAYMGGGAYGAEAAARVYFSKPASELNPAEAAMIAGLLTAPSRLAPTSSLERSQARAATVLRLMNEQGYLSDEDAAYWRTNPATLSAEAESERGGYFADWVMQSGPDFLTRDTADDVVIRTTLDQRVQSALEEAVTRVFSEKVRDGSKAEVAVVVMSADGAVRGMVGGRAMNVSGVFNRATQAVRQTGSAFKPFVYATALELGYSPYDEVDDAPFCMNIPGSGEWCPENYSRNFKGRVTLTQALAESLNIPAVKISESVGRDLVLRVARDFGITRELTDTPSLALGAAEATLLEMTGAYAGILNGGSSVEPYGLIDLRLSGDDQPLMGAGGGIGERVINERAARQLTWMMQKVLTEGTGTRARLDGRPAAGKTGTSQEARDAWFVGFTAEYVTGVWMGYDDNTPLTGVTGGGLPAEIWHEVMQGVLAGLEVRALPAEEPERPAPVAAPQAVERAPDPQPRRAREQDPLERLLNNVIRDILGGG